ncbi:MAG: DUF3333 domain-containing protein, partial [Alphaproteobacteria bacterium]
MTDATLSRITLDTHTSDAATQRLKARYRSEAIFKGLGLGAVLLAMAFLAVFLTTIVREAFPAFTQHYLALPIDLKAEEFNPRNETGAALTTAVNAGNFDGQVTNGLRALFPAVTDRVERRSLSNIVSSGAPSILRRDAVANPAWVGTPRTYQAPLDDMADLYLKGQVTDT